ncbi:MAG: hypothetical protein R3C71_03465 [Candidatus Krumholzibacteriia bacterium]
MFDDAFDRLTRDTLKECGVDPAAADPARVRSEARRMHAFIATGEAFGRVAMAARYYRAGRTLNEFQEDAQTVIDLTALAGGPRDGS